MLAWKSENLRRFAVRSRTPVRYAAAAGPNQVVGASARPLLGPVSHPSRRIRRAEATRGGAVTSLTAGSSKLRSYLASTNLTRLAFDVLAYLVEHAGRVVTQDEILEALWPETYVNPEVTTARSRTDPDQDRSAIKNFAL
jgi:DNA-binding response OmpR family regulator